MISYVDHKPPNNCQPVVATNQEFDITMIWAWGYEKTTEQAA